MTRALVFAYHDVGVRCLQAVLEAGVEVPLVVTHRDQPGEAIWFASVAELARSRGIACITPDDPNSDDVLAACRAAAPDFLFSFYYRRMLGTALLALAPRGAFNLHGSLLPHYRGRAPVNWAILNGERQTGATLHVMDAKPDHGAIVDQEAVTIGADDTARQVFDRVTEAAARVVARSVPRLVAGSAVLRPQQHVGGQYFGGRKPEDGRLGADWPARRLHDLVRAVAPPEYPGAFFDAEGVRIGVSRTHVVRDGDGRPAAAGARFTFFARDGALWIGAADGGVLQVLQATAGGAPLDAAAFVARWRDARLQPDR
ncbi:MAG: formyltransferase [Burkholderiales bacterium]|nr:formyltransferase [Burkholderiales bacterium]